MEGREVFRKAVRATVESAERVLKQADVTAEEIALFVPHQANLGSSTPLASESASIRRVMPSASSTPQHSAAVLRDRACGSRRRRRLKDGDLVLFSGFGAGMTWASAVVRWGGARRLQHMLTGRSARMTNGQDGSTVADDAACDEGADAGVGPGRVILVTGVRAASGWPVRGVPSRRRPRSRHMADETAGGARGPAGTHPLLSVACDVTSPWTSSEPLPRSNKRSDRFRSSSALPDHRRHPAPAQCPKSVGTTSSRRTSPRSTDRETGARTHGSSQARRIVLIRRLSLHGFRGQGELRSLQGRTGGFARSLARRVASRSITSTWWLLGLWPRI